MKYEKGTRVRVASSEEAKDILASVSVPESFAGRSGTIYSNAGSQDDYENCWFIDFDVIPGETEPVRFYVPEEIIEPEAGVLPVFRGGMSFILRDEEAMRSVGVINIYSLIGTVATVIDMRGDKANVSSVNGRIVIPIQCLDYGKLIPGQFYTIRNDAEALASLSKDCAPTFLAGMEVEYYGCDRERFNVRTIRGDQWWVSPDVFAAQSSPVETIEFTSASQMLGHRLSRSPIKREGNLIESSAEYWKSVKDTGVVTRGRISSEVVAAVLVLSGEMRNLITADQRSAFDTAVNAARNKYLESCKPTDHATKIIKAVLRGAGY